MTPSAKRALNFGGNTPNKRQKRSTMVVYRGSKPEMKQMVTTLAYTSSTAQNYRLNDVVAGAGPNERVGAKIKIWSIDGFFESNGSVPLRLDLQVGNNAATTSTHTYAQPVDRDGGWVMKQWVASVGSSPNVAGHFFRHNLPMGMITKYANATATSQNSNAINLKITSLTSTSGSGYARIWYTDS